MNASHVVGHNGIQADVIHIDGGHDYIAVMNDLTAWWRILRPGGILIVDDYVEEGKFWPEVFKATNDFLGRTPQCEL